MFKKIPSAVDSNTEYLCLFGIRLIYRNGKYDGWYNPKLKRVL